VLDRMAARLKARPEILDRRREMVEHPFGSIKQWMNQGAFLMKGLDNGESGSAFDPLKDFSEMAREELRTF
jgi:hypothetical protein